MFHWPLFRKPSQPLRYVAATKSENLAAQRRRNDKRLELEVLMVLLTPEQKAEAIKRAATVKFETPEQRFKRMEPDMFRGMRDAPLKVGKA
jgi:hypothetical protein